MLILISIGVHCHQRGKALAVDKMVQLIQPVMPKAFEKSTGSVEEFQLMTALNRIP